jgi:hypothetical protein
MMTKKLIGAEKLSVANGTGRDRIYEHAPKR